MNVGCVKPPLDQSLPMKYICTIDYIVIPSEDTSMLPHVHKYTDELIFIINGKGNFHIDKHVIPVCEGTICVLRSQTVHHLTVTTPDFLEYCSIQLEPSYINNNFLIGNYKYNIIHIEELIPIIKKVFNAMQTISESDTAPNLSRSEWLYCNTLIALALENFETTKHDIEFEQSPRIFEVWQYIKKHYNEQLSLSVLSQKFHMSISTLTRQFFAEYNISPIEFVIENRIYNASIMLADSDMNVKDISEAVGYSNVSYFTNLFVKRKGCSPTEYRQRKANISAIRIASVKLKPPIHFENI